MKFVSLLTFLFFCTTTFSQEKIDSLVSKTACECMSKTNSVSDELFESCIIEAFQKHQEDIIQYAIEQYGEATEETGYKAGRILGERIGPSLVLTCEKYYRILDSMRSASLLSLNQDSIKTEIAEKNKIRPAQPDSDFYWEMGMLYFYLSDLDQAIANFNASLQQDASSLPSMFYKAWALERKKSYDESLALYTKVAVMTGKNEYNLFIALVKRKRSGL